MSSFNAIPRAYRRIGGLVWAVISVSVAGCVLDTSGEGGALVTCGNGMIDDGEACDGSLLDGASCFDVGFNQGEVACDATCQLDTSACHDCGNGVREGSEDCDGDDLGGETCQSAIGYETGTLACTKQCRFDSTGCSTCGNGSIEADEVCDEWVPSAYSCESETGHESGKLFCSPTCTIDTAQCHTCGDDLAEGVEACDGDDLRGKDCVQLGYAAGTLRCSDGCELDASECFDIPGDWYDVAWPYRRQIVIDESMVDSELFEFPMLVSLTDPDVAAHAVSKDDFVFTDADGVTVLPYEVEVYDDSAGALLAWVKAPALISSIDTKLYVYYGNPSPPLPPDSGAVWSDRFTAVWHLNDAAADETSGALHTDSATGQHPGTQEGNHDVPGKISLAQSFDGVDDFVEVVGPDDFVLGNASFTVSAWIRTTAVASTCLLKKAATATPEQGDKLLGLVAGKLAVDHGSVGYLEGTSLVNDGEWHYVVWTQQADAVGVAESWSLYVDGVLEATAEHQTEEDVPGHVLRLGEGLVGSVFPSSWSGEVDEVRTSDVARSAAWVSTSYVNQYAPETFLTLGPEEQL